MKLKKYNDYILESILIASEKLKGMLSKIDDPISIIMSDLIDKDIKTKYNIIDTTDENSTLSFISDNQAITKLKSGINPNNLFTPSNNKTTIGRVVKSILKDNGIDSTDKEVAKFVDRFKAEYDKSKITKTESPFKIVKGEDIRYWYLEDRYCESSKTGRGTLGKSCMRYEGAQEYLDIYTENPDKVSLVILLDDKGLLKSRALLWETNSGKYLDRIYFTEQSDQELVGNWVKENVGKVLMYADDNITKLKVVLKPGIDYDNYPYMDSLKYYYTTNGELYTKLQSDIKDKRNFLMLESTEGGSEPQNKIYCEFEGDAYDEDDTVYSEKEEVHMTKSRAVWSDYENSWLYKRHTVKSKHLNDYLLENDSFSAYLDKDDNESDYFPEDSDLIAEDKEKRSYYLKELMDEYNGRYLLKGNNHIVYVIEDESRELYRSIYNSNYFNCTLLDMDVLGFVISDVSDIVSEEKYFTKTYESSYYELVKSKINESKTKTNKKEEKLKELDKANEFLKQRDKNYVIKNIIYNNGVENILTSNMEWFKTEVKSSFDRAINDEKYERSNFRYFINDHYDVFNKIFNIITDDIFNYIKYSTIGKPDLENYLSKVELPKSELGDVSLDIYLRNINVIINNILSRMNRLINNYDSSDNNNIKKAFMYIVLRLDKYKDEIKSL